MKVVREDFGHIMVNKELSGHDFFIAELNSVTD